MGTKSKAEQAAESAPICHRGLLTKAQAAEYLSVSLGTLKRMIAEGTVSPIELRGMPRIRRYELDLLIDSLPSAMTSEKVARRQVGAKREAV